MDIVQDVDRAPADPYHLGVGITFRPVVGIDIPSDCNHRRNPAESDDDVRPTDIAGVDDMRHPTRRCSASGLRSPWVSEMTPNLT